MLTHGALIGAMNPPTQAVLARRVEQHADPDQVVAGQIACQHYSACTTIPGDAILTADGYQLAPASDAFTHRATYLEQAVRYLDTVDTGQRLLAVAL